MSSIRDGSPFALGLVLHLEEVPSPAVERGERVHPSWSRARLWHNGRELLDVSAPTPGKAIAALIRGARDFGVDAFSREIEAEVTRELARMVFGRGLGDLDS